MTTTPLPPLPELRGGIFKHTTLGELYDRLQVEQRMVAYATQARADLEAENQRLREALQVLVDNGGIGPEWMFDDARAALENKHG